MASPKDTPCHHCGKYFTKRGIAQHIKHQHPPTSSQNNPSQSSSQINSQINSSQNNPSQNDPQSNKRKSTDATTKNKKSKTITIPKGWKEDDKFDVPITTTNGEPTNITNGTSYEIFMKFLSEEILNHFVEYTNNYSIKNKICYEGKLFVVNVDLIKIFIGVIYLMGLIHFPSTNDYFRSANEKNPYYHCPFLLTVIKRDLFYAINSAFHFDILVLSRKINEIIKKYWKANIYVTVDETIIPFKGRWKGRQHVFGKPHSTGIKLFSLCDGDGYMYHFWIYLGKDNANNEASTVDDYVLTMVKKLPKRDDGLKYCVLADQFFGSYGLAKTLIEKHNVDVILSCRSDRPGELFKDYLQPKTKKQGDVQFLLTEDKKLCALTMYDSSKVNIVTSVGTTKIMNETRIRKRPGILVDYNQHMNSVDKFDATLCLYLYKHRKRKWTRACCYGLLKLLLVDSFVVKNKLDMVEGKTKKGLEQKSFMEEIIRNLCLHSCYGVQQVEKPLVRKQFMGDIAKCLQTMHFPILTPIEKNGKRTIGQCVYCSSSRSHTSFKCNACNKFIHPKCYIIHTRELYFGELKYKKSKWLNI